MIIQHPRCRRCQASTTGVCAEHKRDDLRAAYGPFRQPGAANQFGWRPDEPASFSRAGRQSALLKEILTRLKRIERLLEKQ